ncbi:MAG: hypothetical protein IPH31_05350 [Lewinellaceae bacterium]|nr:hypothetical protein [Lewinellaceae bacterium]
MFGKETVAIDGTKISAQNSKNHLTEDKVAENWSASKTALTNTWTNWTLSTHKKLKRKRPT